MMRFRVYKLKDGKLDTWKAWSLELEKQKEEVKETLRYENVEDEEFHLFEVEGQWYALGLQEFHGERRRADTKVELNRRHFEMMRDCLEPVPTEELYKFP